MLGRVNEPGVGDVGADRLGPLAEIARIAVTVVVVPGIGAALRGADAHGEVAGLLETEGLEAIGVGGVLCFDDEAIAARALAGRAHDDGLGSAKEANLG